LAFHRAEGPGAHGVWWYLVALRFCGEAGRGECDPALPRFGPSDHRLLSHRRHGLDRRHPGRHPRASWGLPGELVERPWVDFAHNRSEAIELARGRADYLLVIDADETLEISEGFEMPRLSADSYDIEVRCGGLTCARKQVLRNSLPWRYEGVVHEYACCHEARSEEFLPGLWIASYRDGARARDPQTYLRDAQTLERALRAEPNNISASRSELDQKAETIPACDSILPGAKTHRCGR
jgi:hypothetical protein